MTLERTLRDKHTTVPLVVTHVERIKKYVVHWGTSPTGHLDHQVSVWLKAPLLLLCFCQKKWSRFSALERENVWCSVMLMKAYQNMSSQLPKGARGNYTLLENWKSDHQRLWVPPSFSMLSSHSNPTLEHSLVSQQIKWYLWVRSCVWVKFLTLAGIPQMEKLKDRTGQDLPQRVMYHYSKIFIQVEERETKTEVCDLSYWKFKSNSKNLFNVKMKIWLLHLYNTVNCYIKHRIDAF